MRSRWWISFKTQLPRVWTTFSLLMWTTIFYGLSLYLRQRNITRVFWSICANSHCTSICWKGPKFLHCQIDLENLLEPFMLGCVCLYPYVWTFCARPRNRAGGTARGHCSVGGPTWWTLEGQFPLLHQHVLKDRSKSEGVGHSVLFMNQEGRRLSSIYSSLNPCFKPTLTHHPWVRHKLWLVKFQAKTLCRKQTLSSQPLHYEPNLVASPLVFKSTDQ